MPRGAALSCKTAPEAVCDSGGATGHSHGPRSRPAQSPAHGAQPPRGLARLDQLSDEAPAAVDHPTGLGDGFLAHRQQRAEVVRAERVVRPHVYLALGTWG